MFALNESVSLAYLTKRPKRGVPLNEVNPVSRGARGYQKLATKSNKAIDCVRSGNAYRKRWGILIDFIKGVHTRIEYLSFRNSSYLHLFVSLLVQRKAEPFNFSC